MRIASFAVDGKEHFGLVTDEGLVDAGHAGSKHRSLQHLLRAGDLDSLRDLQSRGADHAPDEVTWLRPVLWPEKIICIGVNYMHRNEEYRDDSDAPRYPSVFLRTPDSLTGHLQPMLRPPESEQFDYEGEIAVVIGREGRRIDRSVALEHVAGITCMNEGSIRDWLRHAKFNVTQGKNFVASGAIGPWLVTADEIADFNALHVSTHVNGERRQHDTTANLAFPFDYLISYLSTFMLLKPGDVIATGTPTGAGARFDPPRYLRDGDEVTVEVEHVGALRNPVADEAIGV